MAAHMAHGTIAHLHRGYGSYFPYGQVMARHMIFVGLTCHLEAEALRMLEALGVPGSRLVNLTKLRRVHENPDGELRSNVSQLARRNIQQKACFAWPLHAVLLVFTWCFFISAWI